MHTIQIRICSLLFITSMLQGCEDNQDIFRNVSSGAERLFHLNIRQLICDGPESPEETEADEDEGIISPSFSEEFSKMAIIEHPSYPDGDAVSDGKTSQLLRVASKFSVELWNSEFKPELAESCVDTSEYWLNHSSYPIEDAVSGSIDSCDANGVHGK